MNTGLGVVLLCNCLCHFVWGGHTPLTCCFSGSGYGVPSPKAPRIRIVRGYQFHVVAPLCLGFRSMVSPLSRGRARVKVDLFHAARWWNSSSFIRLSRVGELGRGLSRFAFHPRVCGLPVFPPSVRVVKRRGGCGWRSLGGSVVATRIGSPGGADR